MPRFPYMNFPFPFYKNSFKGPTNFYNSPKPYTTPSAESSINTSFNSSANIANHNNINKLNIGNENTDLRNVNKKNKSNKNTGDYLFDLFGLKIYSDDVLLVSLIYFLYSENVKDDGLFLVLVLLLLS